MCWRNSQTYFLSPSMILIIGLGTQAETHNARRQISTAWLPWVFPSRTLTARLLHAARQERRYGQEFDLILPDATLMRTLGKTISPKALTSMHISKIMGTTQQRWAKPITRVQEALKLFTPPSGTSIHQHDAAKVLGGLQENMKATTSSLKLIYRIKTYLIGTQWTFVSSNSKKKEKNRSF